MSSVLGLARPEICRLQGYRSADKRTRWVRLNANESPWPGGEGAQRLNRYPESRSPTLTAMMADYLEVGTDQVLITRGSDDAIDLLVRAFCRAGVDSVMVPVPGFAMYAIAAEIQGANVIKLRLERARNFSFTNIDVLRAWRPNCKLIFLCSPNNPTGNLVARAEIEAVCTALAGKSLVVVDEAYIEFASAESVAGLTRKYSNLVVLRTMSKAHALAASRVGALVAFPEVTKLLNPILPPYPLSADSQRSAMASLTPAALAQTAQRIDRLLIARARLAEGLAGLPSVVKVWPGDGNFLLVQTVNAENFLRRCSAQRVLVRDCSDSEELENCVRVSVGSPEENAALLSAHSELADAG